MVRRTSIQRASKLPSDGVLRTVREDRQHAGGATDQRDEFQRDRDRLLYSEALRRLQGVTQVVSADEGVVSHFDGNAQSFRVLTKLEPHGQHYRGLHLTRATLAATLKYPRPRHSPMNSTAAKYGYYRRPSPMGGCMLTAEELVCRQFEAYNARDLDRFLENFSETITA